MLVELPPGAWGTSCISSLAGLQLTFAALSPECCARRTIRSTGGLADVCRTLQQVSPCRSPEQMHLLLQVFGPESSGKTTLALHAMAAVQKQGGTALLVDAEHAFDPLYSKVCSYSVAAHWQPPGRHPSGTQGPCTALR